MRSPLKLLAFTIVLAVSSLSLSGCNREVRGVITSDERRIWVLQRAGGTDIILRCGDVASPDGPPRPICVRAAQFEQN